LVVIRATLVVLVSPIRCGDADMVIMGHV